MSQFRTIKNKSIKSGGIVPILKDLHKCGIHKTIRSVLGERVKQAKYGYEDGILGWCLVSLCGGKSLHYISTNLQEDLKVIPGLNLPSHDTLGRVLKKLATDMKTHRNINRKAEAEEVFTDYDDNIPMNRMLVKASKKVGALKADHLYTIDIDATFIETRCQGALRKSASGGGTALNAKSGFSPMVCLIGDLPVYVSLRNGDAGASFQVGESLHNCVSLLKESNIKVGRVISDAASLNKELMAYIDNAGIKFNVRYSFKKNQKNFVNEMSRCTWRKTEIETANYFWKCETAAFDYTMSHAYYEKEPAKTFRIVAVRVPTGENIDRDEQERREYVEKKFQQLSKKRVLKDGGKPYLDANWKLIDGYLYKFYITNDYYKTPEEIVLEYNKRGNAERKFSFMKKDFGWNQLPFMKMNENTVYVIAAALANNIYRAMLGKFQKHLKQLRTNMRIDTFRNFFINVSCEYIASKDQYRFRSNTIDFEKFE